MDWNHIYRPNLIQQVIVGVSRNPSQSVVIRNSSRPGNVVLDCFGGAGSTLIACERTGRRARLVELDPYYIDVAVRRWEAFTGREATRDGYPRNVTCRNEPESSHSRHRFGG